VDLFGNVGRDFFASPFPRHQSVTFPRIFIRHAAFVRAGSPIMIGLVRAAAVCATLALGLIPALAADKAFKRDDLADSAIKLEAQIKSEAGPVAKTTATLRTDADTAFQRLDFRTGLQILGQIAATTPEDSANWLRLAKTIFQIRSNSSSEQTFLLERASTAAYLAYQRAGNAAEEADALAVLGRALSDPQAVAACARCAPAVA
jgi:alpha-2-macroglobulin